MQVEILVSSVGKNIKELVSTMNLQSDAIVINQTDNHSLEVFDFHGHQIKGYNFVEKGVGLSRNNALLRASKDILLFSDEDIIYDDGYADKITDAFKKHPEADMILFNMRVGKERATYYTTSWKRIHIWNAGRYPTYSFAIRREVLHKANVTFSLLFGGGAAYSNGEDSLFLKDCLKAGMRVYAIPVELGEEQERESTWFHGYTDKFFYDRGVLYHFLYGKLAKAMAVRFLLAHGNVMCQEIPRKAALKLMTKGIMDMKGSK